MCMAEQEFPKEVAFQFLREMERSWKEEFGDAGLTAQAFAMDEAFHGPMITAMEEASAQVSPSVSPERPPSKSRFGSPSQEKKAANRDPSPDLEDDTAEDSQAPRNPFVRARRGSREEREELRMQRRALYRTAEEGDQAPGSQAGAVQLGEKEMARLQEENRVLRAQIAQNKQDQEAKATAEEADGKLYTEAELNEREAAVSARLTAAHEVALGLLRTELETAKAVAAGAGREQIAEALRRASAAELDAQRYYQASRLGPLGLGIGLGLGSRLGPLAASPLIHRPCSAADPWPSLSRSS